MRYLVFVCNGLVSSTIIA